MSNHVEGVVYKVYPKSFGNKTRYTIKLDGIKVWYRANENRYAGIAEPGNRIAFEADDLPDGESAKIVDGSVRLAQAPSAAASGTPYVGGGGGDRQNNIVYQSSRKDALEMVNLLVSSGALKLPAAQKAKVAAVEAALDRYTAQFFADVSELGAVVREAEGGGESVSEDDADDDESDDE